MNEKTKKFINLKSITIAAVLIALLAIGSAIAFFTDKDNKTNDFTVGNISIQLTEPNWNADNGKDLTPNKTISKDPQITNDGPNDAFVFLQVKVPVANVKTAAADGSLQAAKSQDLFTYTVNDSWVEVSRKSSADSTTYIYAYVGNDGAMKTLAPGKTTNSLFDSVTFLNLVEGQIDEGTQISVDVDAYGIQTTDLGTTAPAEVLKLIQTQNK